VGRALVRVLKLMCVNVWWEWSKSGQRPSYIPASPDRTYRDDGWISMPDWLGNGKERVLAKDMLPFAVGRVYVQKLRLKTQKEWFAWSKSGQRPSNIPSDPAVTYRDDGWISMPDWLGYWTRYDMLPFAVGRAYAWKLKLRSQKEWKEWSKSGQRPFNIPSNPQTTYRDDGWISMPDWLGNGGTSNQARHVNMLPFAAARAYVRKLKLRSAKEWKEWSKSGQRPTDIPSSPDQTYRDAGWISWPDWIGCARVAWKSFTEGRVLARGLELKSKEGWEVWSKSGQRPSDIPSLPSSVYRNDGWISWPDWLGNGKGRVLAKDTLPFVVGRAYAQKLKLRTQKEWFAWSKSGQRPFNIPGSPHKTYRDDGWISYPDWLGYGSEGAAASRSSSSSSSATTAPKKKTKKKRKRRPTTTHPSDLPPPPPPSTFPFKPYIKTEPSSSKSSGGSSDRSTEPPLRKIKKEEDA
jgi:hypothetical protein